MQHHQLAILQEKLIKIRAQKAKLSLHKVSGHTDFDRQIKAVKDKINQLGRRGVLKMAIVVVKTNEIIETFTYLFHDLDDESIYTLLEYYRRNAQTTISRSVVEVPLGLPIPSSLENQVISWHISS
jgi:hypothetical protein